MNILFVTLFALETNTSVTKSNYGIIKGFLDLGHEVTVLMPEISEKVSYFDNSYDLSNVKIERIKNDNLGQKIANSSSNATGIKQHCLNLARNIYAKCKLFDRTKLLVKEAKNFGQFDRYFDVVISTSDPKTSHLFVSEMIKCGLKYGKWIQHWGDPLAGDISRNSIHPNFLLENIEKKIISNADKVVYVSPFTLEVQKQRYRYHATKLKFVPLPCDEDYNESGNKNKGISEVGQLKVVYLGDYSSKIRNILPLYKACADLDCVSLTIAGNTDIDLLEKDNIRIMQRIPQKQAKELEDQADVIVSIGNLNGNQIPGKIYYAASTNKAILVAVDGDNKVQMKEYLDSYNRYICCDNTIESITASLLSLSKNPVKQYDVPDLLRSINVATHIIE